MEDIWRRIERWLQINVPEALESLQAGASDEQIATAEDFLAVKFPEDVKASLRIHNGQAAYDFGLIDGRELLSLERMQDEWKVWKDLLDGGTFEGSMSEPEAGIRKDWWNAQWIPLTYDGAGNHECLDLDPAEGGKRGQIITMWHDGPEREVVAGDFRRWLEQYADGLESGQYAFSEEYNGIVNVDDL